jgi:hypothetical protein
MMRNNQVDEQKSEFNFLLLHSTVEVPFSVPQFKVFPHLDFSDPQSITLCVKLYYIKIFLSLVFISTAPKINLK